MYAHGFRVYFTPLSGVLFAFPSRYWFTIGRQRVLSLGGWSPHVQTGFHVPRPTRITASIVSHTGLSPSMAVLPRTFCYNTSRFKASPRSLVATRGISVDFFSSGYLDISVLRVRLFILYIQMKILLRVGFPIRKSSDQSSFDSSPRLIAAYYVLHRLLPPRHPPCALSRLVI